MTLEVENMLPNCLFAIFWETSNTNSPNNGVQKIVKSVFSLMVTPAVVREVRRHFNCPSLEGAELEDQVINTTLLLSK